MSAAATEGRHPFKVGQLVRLAFGCDGAQIDGHIVAFQRDLRGREAAAIRVYSVPTWVHVEPLENLAVIDARPGFSVEPEAAQSAQRFAERRAALLKLPAIELKP